MFPLRVTDVEINIKSKRLIGPINLEIEQNGISKDQNLRRTER